MVPSNLPALFSKFSQASTYVCSASRSPCSFQNWYSTTSHLYLHNIIACRLNNCIRDSLTHERVCSEFIERLKISETSYQTEGWGTSIHIVMARLETEKRPKLVGKQDKKPDMLHYKTFGQQRHVCIPSLCLTILCHPSAEP